MSLQRIESCHSVWTFDRERQRFRRSPRFGTGAGSASSGWERFYGLEIDMATGAFSVSLDPMGSRLLRSWRHLDPCPHCGASSEAPDGDEVTKELRLQRAPEIAEEFPG